MYITFAERANNCIALHVPLTHNSHKNDIRPPIIELEKRLALYRTVDPL